MNLAHIINPVKVEPASDLFSAQQITFETMWIARDFSKDKVRVDLFTTQFPEDHEFIPNFFTKLPDLSRSVLNIKNDFQTKRKYPLIKDILQKLFDASDADYFIYTNSDIALMPQFYLAVSDFISQGYDGFIINRRRVSRKFKSVEDIPLMFSEIGRPHPGFDCFVFKRSLFPKFVLDNICIGVPFVEASLAHNLFAFCNNFKLFTDKHLTIHVGLEVMPERDSEYHRYNHEEFKKVYQQLKKHLYPGKLPYSTLPFPKKVLRWALNPAVFILPNMEIEIKGWWNKIKFRLNEERWKKLEGD